MKSCKISSWIWSQISEYEKQTDLLRREYPLYAGSIGPKPGTIGKTAYSPRLSSYRIGISNSEIKKEAIELSQLAAKNYQQEPDNIWAAVWQSKMDLIPENPTWPQNTEEHGRRERTLDPIFWRRIIRKTIREAREVANLERKRIGKQHIYVSPDGMRDRQEQKKDLLNFLANSYLYDTLTGELVTMADSTQMQERTQARLLNRVNGVQDYADTMGLKAFFVTLTVPARMHSNPTAGKCSWNGTTPKESQKWIAERWAKVQRKIQKAKIDWIYLRSVEPHKDGTPHWHLVLWTKSKNMTRIESQFRKYWPAENRHGMKIEAATKSAPAYIWKYILKNTGGNPGEESSAARVDAWRSMWRIYAFRFGGTLLPTGAIGQFDELRRAENRPTDPTTGKLWDAAQAGKFGDFLGICKGEKKMSYLMIPKINKYGETIFQKFGLEDAREMIISRDPGRYKLISRTLKTQGVNCFQEAKAWTEATASDERQRDIAGILGQIRWLLETS
jgi:hypothetical protein